MRIYVKERICREIAPGIWWACFVTRTGRHTFFDGDVFQGPTPKNWRALTPPYAHKKPRQRGICAESDGACRLTLPWWGWGALMGPRKLAPAPPI